MKNKKYNISVIGLGVGFSHALQIKKDRNLNLISIYDPDLKKAKILSKRLNCKYNKSYNEVLRQNELNGLVIASPDNHHCDQIIKSIKNSKNFFVEKPFCNNKNELEKIKKELKSKKKLKFEFNLILRTVPLYKWLKSKISSKFFGEIYSIEASYLYGRSEKIIKGWRGKAKNYSGMNGGGIHMIDLICWLLNKKPKEVHSFGNKICFKRYRFNFEDFENSIFYFNNHLLASVNVHLGCVHKHHHILKIFGTKKTFIYDDKGPRIFSNKKEGSHAKKINLLSLPKDKTILMKNFFKNIMKKKFDKKKINDTFNLVHILNAVRISHIKKKKIKISYEKN